MVTLTCEQLEERLAALHRASLELVQDTALDSLLEKIAALACEQAGARYAAVGVLDESGGLEKFITIGMTDAEVARMAHPPRGLGLIAALMQSAGPIRVDDIATDPRAVGFPPHHPPMTSFLGVPIRHGTHNLGQIYLTSKADAAGFSDEDERVIETLAAYAAIAINNARLYERLRQREESLTRRNEILALLNDLSPILVSSSDVNQILDQGVMQVMEYLGLEIGEVFLRQDDGKTLARVYHRGPVHAIFARDKFKVGQGMVGSTVHTAQPMLAEIPGSDGHDLDAGFMAASFRQVACFPLSGRLGVLGAMCVASTEPRPMDELEMQFLNSIGAWIGMSIENVRLNVQQRRLAVLEERERIGMDLHDGIIQSIYAVGLTLEHARLLMDGETGQPRERIEQAIAALNETIRDIRTYILDLRPRQLRDENLMQGLQRLVNEFRANTLVDINLQGPDDSLSNLPNAQAVALFHIAQEALANVAKHAHAKHVDVVVWSTSDRALLEVRDNGRGFDPDRTRLSLGHGLANMQTRARNVGGDVEFSSEISAGTTVLAWMPFSNES